MNKKIEQLYRVINSSNINFLIGAGLSSPFLSILNDIEVFLSDPQKSPEEILEKKKEYFNKVMLKNLEVIDEIPEPLKDSVLSNYKTFYKIINNILLNRENSILTKQVNIFTTNIDVLSEKALEETGIEFNDGFNGRFNPVFNLGNFKKSYFRKSLHYERTSEIPVFNLLKLHGSLTWRIDTSKDKIFLDKDLNLVRDVKANVNTGNFENYYKKLTIVNPTKKKFEETLLEQYYYDLLRIYSNELEKENSVLFVLGFSFEDKHIKDMTMRVADSNPTLKVYIFAHKQNSAIYSAMETEAKNQNIEIVLPENGEEFDHETLNGEVFGKVIPYTEFSDEIRREEETNAVDET